MKKMTPLLITGLLMLTQTLDAGGRGGGIGFALPTRNSSSDSAPASQDNAVPTAPQSGKTAQLGNVRQGSGKRVEPVHSGQNQTHSNSRTSAVAATGREERPERHDSDWWRQHYHRIVFVLGAYYYWDDGYWYPALGYDPNYSYYDDGPIYSYDNLLPDQVIANVQTALHQDGYYFGPITGSINAATQVAIARYQRDYGLPVTATIDEPTVESLGLA